MILNMTFMVLLNFLRFNTQVSGILITSKNSRSTSNEIVDVFQTTYIRSKFKNATVILSDTSTDLSKSLRIDTSSPTESSNSSIIESYTSGVILTKHFLSVIFNYWENFFVHEQDKFNKADVSNSTSELYKYTKPIKNTNLDDLLVVNTTTTTTTTKNAIPEPSQKLLLPVSDDVTYFHLWKEIGITEENNNAADNFTHESTPPPPPPSPSSSQYGHDNNSDKLKGEYDDQQQHSDRATRMKSILVKDTRYRSLMKKWITNRSRDGAARATGDFSTNSSTTGGGVLSSKKNICELCPSEANHSQNDTSSDDEINTVVTCATANVNASCGTVNHTSSTANDKSTKSDVEGDPEARFYDPLMPYPEEYPEEYQTIQNGPALIISRTTYTRIPNVTYTTITMVTLPTYRLVEKAENAFAATLFEERRSSS